MPCSYYTSYMHLLIKITIFIGSYKLPITNTQDTVQINKNIVSACSTLCVACSYAPYILITNKLTSSLIKTLLNNIFSLRSLIISIMIFKVIPFKMLFFRKLRINNRQRHPHHTKFIKSIPFTFSIFHC